MGVDLDAEMSHVSSYFILFFSSPFSPFIIYLLLFCIV